MSKIEKVSKCKQPDLWRAINQQYDFATFASTYLRSIWLLNAPSYIIRHLNFIGISVPVMHLKSVNFHLN